MPVFCSLDFDIIGVVVAFISWAVPPAAFGLGKPPAVDGFDLLPAIVVEVLAVDIVGSKALCANVRDKASTHPVPARLLALPTKGAGGPGKLLSVEESADGTHDVIGE